MCVDVQIKHLDCGTIAAIRIRYDPFETVAGRDINHLRPSGGRWRTMRHRYRERARFRNDPSLLWIGRGARHVDWTEDTTVSIERNWKTVAFRTIVSGQQEV